jgi:hypothetical protein
MKIENQHKYTANPPYRLFGFSQKFLIEKKGIIIIIIILCFAHGQIYGR